MIFVRWFVPCLGLFLSACGEKESAPAESAVIADPHGDAVREFIKAPQRFREVVATVRDEASYDRAVPGLTEVVDHFRNSAEMFRKLSPPPESEQAKYRQMIDDGYRDTNPTGKDMLSLIMIKSREKEVSAWLESFTLAGSDAGMEAARLYGKIRLSGEDKEEEEVEKLRAQMRGLAEEQRPETFKKLESKGRPEPIETGENPLLRHLDGQDEAKE